MSTTHRYNTRSQSKKDTIKDMTPPTNVYELPKEPLEAEMKALLHIKKELHLLLTATINSDSNSIERLEKIIEVFTAIIATPDILKINNILHQAVYNSTIHIEEEMDRVHTMVDEKRQILFRVMRMLFRHVRDVCQKYKC